MKTIGVLTSGGDSPGMNCAIRSVVRTAVGKGLKVYGIKKGYSGLLEGDFEAMDVSSVGNIIQRGGTILQTSRCPEFHEAEARKEAANLLKRKKIDGLVIIGGDGSFNGAIHLHQEHNIPIAGIPGTIDNDISGTDYTLGFDTAVQTACEAVDKIRDTAHSHARTFIVEVMGRSSSAIAVHVGICTGAENVILPYKGVELKTIAEDIERGIARGKTSSIIIVAEGQEVGMSYQVQKKLKEDYKRDAHVCILGHTQRGGSPSSIDRFLGSRMGFMAVESLIQGGGPKVAGFVNGKVTLVPFRECLEKRNEYELPYVEMMRALSI